MKAIQLTAPALDAFRRTELPEPKAARGEVLLRLRAASLNFVDVAIATGNFPGASFPMVPVADGAGEIAALGDGVDGWKVGERVVPHFMPNWLGGAITPVPLGLLIDVGLAWLVLPVVAGLLGLSLLCAGGARESATARAQAVPAE